MCHSLILASSMWFSRMIIPSLFISVGRSWGSWILTSIMVSSFISVAHEFPSAPLEYTFRLFTIRSYRTTFDSFSCSSWRIRIFSLVIWFTPRIPSLVWSAISPMEGTSLTRSSSSSVLRKYLSSNWISFFINFLYFYTIHPFDTFELAFLLTRDEHVGFPTRTRSPSPTDSMDIRLGIMRHMIIDDDIDVIHIESARRDIRRDERVDPSLFIVTESTDTIALIEIAMEVGTRDTIPFEVSEELFRFTLHLRKYDGTFSWIIREDLLEEEILIHLRDTDEGMIDSIDCHCLTHADSLIIRTDIFWDETSDSIWIGRWECHHLFQRWKGLPDRTHSIDESHIHHHIDFVDDERFHAWEIDPSTIHEIEKASWSRDHDLWSSCEFFTLFSYVWSTEYDTRAHTDSLREIPDFFLRLHREFACRLEYECLGLSELRIDTMEDRYDEWRGLATPSLRLGDDMFARECERDHGSLNVSRSRISEDFEGREYLASESEFCKKHEKKVKK